MHKMVYCLQCSDNTNINKTNNVNESNLTISIDDQIVRKHVVGRKLRHLSRRLAAQLGDFLSEQAKEGDLSWIDRKHGTNLLGEYKAKKRADYLALKRREYGL